MLPQNLHWKLKDALRFQVCKCTAVSNGKLLMFVCVIENLHIWINSFVLSLSHCLSIN